MTVTPTTMQVDGDMCPICKSSRYLNPDMRFLVNPECYHKMCESCVDRIFSWGPSLCPYPGCGKTLRKNKFKTQMFEDLAVEREVDIRQRVTKVFNKRQEDFDTLQEYNNYLERVEDIIFNLVNGIDVEKTEAELRAYEAENKNSIMANILRVKQEEEQIMELEKLEAERRRQNAQLEYQMNQEEKEIRKQAEKDTLRELAQGNEDAAAIVERVNRKVEEKTRAARQELEEKVRRSMLAPRISALRREEGSGTPFTPFNGDRQKEYLFTVQDDYYDPFFNDIKEDSQYLASGFNLRDVYKHSLVQAFFGLGCNVQVEKAA